jgi:hypothetical protein
VKAQPRERLVRRTFYAPATGQRCWEDAPCPAASMRPFPRDPSVSVVLGRDPELTMRRRALSSGLIARDQVTCALQATAKDREAQHDALLNRGSRAKVKRDAEPSIRGGVAHARCTSMEQLKDLYAAKLGPARRSPECGGLSVFLTTVAAQAEDDTTC